MSFETEKRDPKRQRLWESQIAKRLGCKIFGRVMINGSCVLMKHTVDSHRLVEILIVSASIGDDRFYVDDTSRSSMSGTFDIRRRAP